MEAVILASISHAWLIVITCILSEICLIPLVCAMDRELTGVVSMCILWIQKCKNDQRISRKNSIILIKYNLFHKIYFTNNFELTTQTKNS